MLRRRLGRSGIEISAMGLGCWAIGGPWTFDGEQMGWGQIDDAESIRAIHCALDMGITLFDTAANYGAGHSETNLGQAVASRRDRVVIATKFGYLVDEAKRAVTEDYDVPGHMRRDCEASLRRLNTDYIDLYQLHVGPYDTEQVIAVRDGLEALVVEGKIRWYGWSTDNPAGARVLSAGAHCTAIQHLLNMGVDAPEMLAACDEGDLASINRRPLGSGLLTGKLTPDTQFAPDDTRHDWDMPSGCARSRQGARSSPQTVVLSHRQRWLGCGRAVRVASRFRGSARRPRCRRMPARWIRRHSPWMMSGRSIGCSTVHSRPTTDVRQCNCRTNAFRLTRSRACPKRVPAAVALPMSHCYELLL